MSARSSDVFEILQTLESLFKTSSWFDKLEMEINPDKDFKKVQKMWSIIKDGMNSEQLLHKTKMNLVLEDE